LWTLVRVPIALALSLPVVVLLLSLRDYYSSETSASVSEEIPALPLGLEDLGLTPPEAPMLPSYRTNRTASKWMAQYLSAWSHYLVYQTGGALWYLLRPLLAQTPLWDMYTIGVKTWRSFLWIAEALRKTLVLGSGLGFLWGMYSFIRALPFGILRKGTGCVHRCRRQHLPPLGEFEEAMPDFSSNPSEDWDLIDFSDDEELSTHVGGEKGQHKEKATRVPIEAVTKPLTPISRRVSNIAKILKTSSIISIEMVGKS